jgi:adenosylhomocysteinase
VAIRRSTRTSSTRRARGSTGAAGARAQAKPKPQAKPAAKPADSARDWQSAIGKSGDPKSQKALVTRWAAHFQDARKNKPVVGDRGTVGGFDQKQLDVLFDLFWTAPPGADEDAIAALAKKNPAFKGTEINGSRLKTVCRYRPESFPFSWADRKRSVCSFIVVESMTTTPADQSAGKVLELLRDAHDEFVPEVTMKKLAKNRWLQDPHVYPFADRMPLRDDKKGYRLDTTGEIVGLPRFKGALAMSQELADLVVELSKDPRLQYGTTFDEYMLILEEGVGEKFSYNQFRHLREQFDEVPDWYSVERMMRERLVEKTREIFDATPMGATEMVDALVEQLGVKPFEPSRFYIFRQEFGDVVPRFRQSNLDRLMADAETFAAAVKADPGKELNEIGEKLGFSHNRLKGVIRILRLNNPDALPRRRSNTPYSAQEKKWLKDAVKNHPVGAPLSELYETLDEAHPELFERHPIEPQELSRVVRKQAGVDSWFDHQHARFDELFAKVVKGADSGVTLSEILDQLRDEHDCRYGYTFLKTRIREAVAKPKEFPTIAKLANKAGRFPWQLGVDYSEDLAQLVADTMKANPKDGLREVVGRLMRKKSFRDQYPTFGAGHVYQLRERFPDIVPYIDDLKSPAAKKELKKFNGELSKLADKAVAVAKKLGHDGLSIAAVSRELGIDAIQVRKAIVRAPERFPWYRRRGTGNIDLQLAYRVARAMEEAPLGATLGEIAEGLKADADFSERYPAFTRATINTLREVYSDVVPRWSDRDVLLRGEMLVDALTHAKKGSAFSTTVKKLEEENPGFFSGAYGDEAYVGRLLADTDRFPSAKALFDGDALVLKGHGVKRGKPRATLSEIATRAARLTKVPESLDLVDLVASFAKDKPLSSGQRYEVVCVQHLLDSQLPVYDALKKLGMSPARSTIIGVPYSASELVVDSLEDKGWDVRVPSLDMDKWVDEIRGVLYERLESALRSHRDIVVMDDGGLVTKLVATDPLLSKHAKKFRIVEQTRRGITVADKVGAATPLVNVAQSWGKYVEGPLIGSDVEEKLVERLAKTGAIDLDKKLPLKGKKVGVIGGGTIGLPIAEQMRQLGAEVTVLDIDPKARARAKKEGFDVADPDDKAGFFGEQDIICGATGVRSMSPDELALLKPGAVISSASSKLVEIDVGALREMSVGEPEVIDDKSHPPSLRFHLEGGGHIDLLASGFPVNFDGGEENIAPEHIQLTRALMVVGLLQATGAKVPGVKRLDVELQIAILEKFADIHRDTANDELRQALDEGLRELRKAAQTTGASYRRSG